MSENLDKLVLDRLYAREASLVNHANGVDAKGSYILVAITFLAVQLTGLLGKPGLQHFHLLIFVSGASLIAATFSTVLSLRLATFLDEGADGLEAWVLKTGNDGYTEDEILEQVRHGSEDRIRANAAILANRSRWIERAFYAVIVALTLNLIALLIATF